MMQVLTLISAYCQYARLAGLSEQTIRRRRKVLRMFARETATTSPDQLTRARIERWLLTRPHPQTRRSYLGDLRAWCRWMVRDGVLDHDPTDGIPTPKVPTRTPTPLTRQHVALLRSTVVDPVDRAIISLALFAGLRVSEIAALDGSDIDADRGLLVVRRGKGGKGRTVPAGAVVLATCQRSGPAIGVKMSGGNVSARIRRCLRAAGIDRRPHDLRATLATELLRSTGDVAMVARMLGHASLTTTQRYVLVDLPRGGVVDGLFAA